jgi:hypothetical protein
MDETKVDVIPARCDCARHSLAVTQSPEVDVVSIVIRPTAQD